MRHTPLDTLCTLKTITVSTLLTALLAGCGSNVYMEEDNNAGFLKPVEQNVDPIAPLILRVVGYGIAPGHKNLKPAQKRLMALRASKMDAYRAMAERVYGLQLQGSTTVRDMIVQDDRFRTYVETYMHGARVVSSDLLKDGTVETVMEMVVDQGFRNCLATVDERRANTDCRAPLGIDEDSYVLNQQRQRVSSESKSTSQSYFIE